MGSTHLNNTLNTLSSLNDDNHRFYYSLPALEKQGFGKISRLPISIRIMLESLLRNCDGKRVKEEDIHRLAKWGSRAQYEGEVPFIVSRVLLQDFTGVPLVVDLAAMRDAVADKGLDPALIEPKVPVDLVIDHSVQVDRSGTKDAFSFNLNLEFERNQERYSFLKWGEQAFKTFAVVPPGIGIVHQVNLEYFASVVSEQKIENKKILFPDTLVGTDSHTTMINGLGIVAWGVGGIEAEAAMLGQPVTLQMPEVIGVHMSGKLQEGVTATDLALRITELLRKENVVDKFVEFFGEGTASLTVADRATIANMSPEYGATMGFFPVDDKTLHYLRMTGRKEEAITQIRDYLIAQHLFGVPRKGDIDFTKVIELDLHTLTSSVAGPKRPQDRILVSELKKKFHALLLAEPSAGGYGKSEEQAQMKVHVQTGKAFSPDTPHDSGGTQKGAPCTTWSEEEMVSNRPFTTPHISPGYSVEHPTDGFLSCGSVVIAAITSCTNTSNPAVMLAAGLLAKKAVEKGLKVKPFVKTSLAPGSRIVTEYLKKADLQKYLDALGFQLVAYGCTTCIGNSGPLDEKIENVIKNHDLIAASVLSGNRNFEARIHSAVKANFLMSPPLVIAYAIAGKVDIDMEKEPLGYDPQGKPVFLKDIWPSNHEVDKAVYDHLNPQMFKERYANILQDNPMWKEVKIKKGDRYSWEAKSTYIQNPPYFENFTIELPKKKHLREMRPLALLGDSVTTDHISPAGAFKSDSPAGKYLLAQGVKPEDFNSYGSRRGNHEVMMRGTFANVRIKNKLAGGVEGGYTKLMPEGTVLPIFDAAQTYLRRQVPLIVFAGWDYGMGSSRDWAAKGTLLLGVAAVVARSFERIHRSNLAGMGVLPLEFTHDQSHESLRITGEETFSILGLEKGITARQKAVLEITRPGGKVEQVDVIVRLDTPIDIDYYQHGGIMPYVLRHL